MSTEPTTARRGSARKLIVVDTRPLKIPAYRRLWTSAAIATIGSHLTVIAMPKQIYDLTGSSGFVGLTGVAVLVPLLFFGLWGGAISDTVDRRKLLLVTNTGVALTSAGLWLQALLGVGSVWLVLLLLSVHTAFLSVFTLTRGAAFARLVPVELLPSAIALDTPVGEFGAIFVPVLAGALMPVVGLSTLYLIDTVARTVTLVALWRLPSLSPLSGQSRRAGLRDVLDGFRYVGTQKILLASFLVDIIAMVAGMPRALFPEMAKQTFGDSPGGSSALGWLSAAIPIGAMLCGLGSGWLSRISRHGVGLTIAACVWATAVVGFGLSHSLWLAVVFLAIGGVANFVSTVFRSAILQTATTDHMRGRLQGVSMVVGSGSQRISDVTHGWMAAGVGTAATAVGGGMLVIMATIVAVALIPVFWRYRAPTSPS